MCIRDRLIPPCQAFSIDCGLKAAKISANTFLVHLAVYGMPFLEIAHRSSGMMEPHWNREPALLRERYYHSGRGDLGGVRSHWGGSAAHRSTLLQTATIALAALAARGWRTASARAATP
eukprot:9407099-Alexandrium_andersonii.AAC.1